jgi:hypothetical protein
MRCLYCGKELALLKRLRGGGEFCSDTHKQSYQEEYNRLALSRLLQAQTKGQQAPNSPPQTPAQNTPPPPSVSVAVEEPGPEVAANGVPAPPVQAAPLREEAVVEPVPEPIAAEEPGTSAEMGEEASVGAEPEPLSTADFLLESPALAVPADGTPYLEAWLELSVGPAMSDWQIQNGVFSLSPADLLSLDLPPEASSLAEHAFPADLSPREFATAQPDPPPPATTNQKKARVNRLPAGARIAVDIPPSSVAVAADQSLSQAIAFQSAVLFDESQLLELSLSSIDFHAEDFDLVVSNNGAGNHQDHALPNLVPAEAEVEAPVESDTPRASLEALSRLHDELVQQETAREAITPADPPEAPVEVVAAVAVQVLDKPETVPEDAVPEDGPAKARPAVDLFDISLKIFPPGKPALIGGDALPTNTAPLLPHLKSLPLRPKVALATGYAPPSKSPAPSTKPAAPPPAPPQAPSKPAPGGKPAARLTQPKQPVRSAKPAQPAAAKVASPKVEAAKPEAVPAAQPDIPEALPKPEVAAKVAIKPEPAPKVSPAEKEPAAKPAPVADQEKPVADKVEPAVDQEKPKVDAVKPAADPPRPAPERTRTLVEPASKETVPSFGIAQTPNGSFLGSLKVKLGIAIVLLVIACAYFLGWGGAKSKPAGSNPAVSSDGSGPSIILGEGGWVEGWGGDPSGIHAERQITIYRPSLKLSDYRLEFQGSIDTKSIGWVFRASDPENYYAMKLMTVSAGLSPKVALFKYLVANGKQTQVGRVPIDIAVQADTVFDIRVDIRGPQFTTYIQGQQVDSWTDDQLKVGGAGFLNEREERGKVKSVSIRYLSGASK